jgi:hypothetical protein
MLALDIYGRAFNRKRIVEPMLEDIIQTGVELGKKHNNPMFVTYANDFVNQLEGRPTFHGRKIDDWIGGALNKDGKLRWVPSAIDRALIGVSSLFWAGALGGNPRYPVMQVATGLATTVGRFGLFRTSRALWEMGTPEGQLINKQIGTYDSFTTIYESGFMRNFADMMKRASTPLEKVEIASQGMAQTISKHGYTVSPIGVMSTAQTEEFIRGVTAHAAVDMYMSKLGISSWEEAIEKNMGRRIMFEALRASEEVNHMFGALGRSPWITRMAGRGPTVSATQFLSFIPKQTEELLSQFQRNPGAIAMFMAASGWMSRIAAEQLGINTTNYVGFGYLPETLDDVSAPAVDTMMNLMSFLSAASRRDPAEAKRAAEQFLNSASTMIPLMSGIKTVGKTHERLTTGEITAASGNKVRDLDFKELLSTNPSISLTDIGTAIRPEEGNPNALAPGLGGELLPSLFGQQNIREEVARRGLKTMQAESRRIYFNVRNLVDDVIKGYEDGDVDAMRAAAAELGNTYNIRIQSDRPFIAAIEAREISQFLRQVKENPLLMDRFYEIGKEYGLLAAPQTNDSNTP